MNVLARHFDADGCPIKIVVDPHPKSRSGAARKLGNNLRRHDDPRGVRTCPLEKESRVIVRIPGAIPQIQLSPSHGNTVSYGTMRDYYATAFWKKRPGSYPGRLDMQSLEVEIIQIESNAT